MIDHATTSEQRLTALRNMRVRDALALLVWGVGWEVAAGVLVSSVLGEQARAAGIRVPQINSRPQHLGPLGLGQDLNHPASGEEFPDATDDTTEESDDNTRL